MSASNTPGACYKIVVRTAEEAVNLIRERWGEKAKVISVRQVEGSGLSKFLQAPKLEVVVQLEDIAEKPEEPAPTAEVPEPVKTRELEEAVASRDSGRMENQFERVLRKSGISEAILARLQMHSEWESMTKLQLSDAFTRLAILLRNEFRDRPKRTLAGRTAFIGTPGVGKTSALCKQLAQDVFLRNRRAEVMKVDSDQPNSGEGLEVFCEALGVPYLRSIKDISDQSDSVYLDLPGFRMDSVADTENVARLLNETGASSRVLVLNAAYELDLLKRTCLIGERLKATHVVFTHLDEMIRWGKLWEFLFLGNMTPLFISNGQNIASDIVEDVLEAVIKKTLG